MIFQEGEEEYYSKTPWAVYPRIKLTGYLKDVDFAFRRIVGGQGTEEDVGIIGDYLKLCQKISEAMNVRDDNHKQTYPCNFFVVAPKDIRPYEMDLLSTKLLGKDFLSKEDKRILTNLNYKIEQHFPRPKDYINEKVEKYEKTLKSFRLKRQYSFNGKQFVVDYSSDEAFQDLCKKVEEVIKKYDLPNYSYCVFTVGAQIVNGRDVIKMPGMETKTNTQAEPVKAEESPKPQPNSNKELA